MIKSFFDELDSIFELYAGKSVRDFLTYRVQAREAEFLREARPQHLQLRFTSYGPMKEIGIPEKFKLDGLLTRVYDNPGYHYATHTPINKVMNWIRKVDREAVEGKRMAATRFVSYELIFGPFSFFFRSDKLPRVKINALLQERKENIEEIIRKNKKRN